MRNAVYAVETVRIHISTYIFKSHHVCEGFFIKIFSPPRHEVKLKININSLCLSAFVAILSGLSGLGWKKMVEMFFRVFALSCLISDFCLFGAGG